MDDLKYLNKKIDHVDFALSDKDISNTLRRLLERRRRGLVLERDTLLAESKHGVSL